MQRNMEDSKLQFKILYVKINERKKNERLNLNFICKIERRLERLNKLCIKT